MERRGNASLQFTPTWAISIVCLCIIIISFSLEALLHFIRQFLTKRRRKSLVRAMEKIETEMMTMGFISLLLTISEVPVSKICVRQDVVDSFHPCKHPLKRRRILLSTRQVAGLSSDTIGQSFCQTKMNRWKAWEEETRSLRYQISNDPRRFRLSHQTSFGRRHLKMWTCHPVLLWPICFIRQFSHSASRSDYFTLRNGFILANAGENRSFNFHKFLARAFDDDFEQLVGLRLWIWMLCLLFIFFSAQEFYNYYWLPFLPLLLILAVGTKLETIITKMCMESCKHNTITRGTILVNPSNDYFWFKNPKLLLYLLQFILIQNSFQLAFFIWAWYQFGLRSCFNQETEDVVIRITAGLIIQLLCGYVTLPIYALVTQMGSGEKKTVFTERVKAGLRNWQWKARKLQNSSTMNSPNHQIINSSVPLITPPNTEIKKQEIEEEEEEEEENEIDEEPCSSSNKQESNNSTCEIPGEERRSSTDVDEVSFASSWKKMSSDLGGGSDEFRSDVIEAEPEPEVELEEEEDRPSNY